MAQGELTTKEVAARFGLKPHELKKLLSREVEIGVRRQGTKLYWGPEAIAAVRAFVEERRSAGGFETEGAKIYWEATELAADLLERLKSAVAEFGGVCEKLMAHPPSTMVFVHTLQHRHYALTKPIGVLVSPRRLPDQRRAIRASLPELRIECFGPTVEAAIQEFRHRLLSLYLALSTNREGEEERWAALEQLVSEGDAL